MYYPDVGISVITVKFHQNSFSGFLGKRATNILPSSQTFVFIILVLVGFLSKEIPLQRQTFILFLNSERNEASQQPVTTARRSETCQRTVPERCFRTNSVRNDAVATRRMSADSLAAVHRARKIRVLAFSPKLDGDCTMGTKHQRPQF